MQITINFEVLRKVGVVLFVLAGLFSLAASISYVRFRLNSFDYFQISEVDLNMRLPEIRARYLQLQAEQKTRNPNTANPPFVGPPEEPKP